MRRLISRCGRCLAFVRQVRQADGSYTPYDTDSHGELVREPDGAAKSHDCEDHLPRAEA